MTDTTFEYVFPAVRGIQAGREYYISMCPLRLIPKLFLFDDEELVPELRAQRVLNRSRIPEIADYLVGNRDSYVFSAITASIDGSVRFEPLGASGDSSRLGSLRVDMSSRFIVNDGQHRRAAIEEAIKRDPKLGDETLAVVFFLDRGLERCQQMFADLNRHAVRPARSLGLLYDHRNALAQLTRLVVARSQAFNGLVEMERSTLSERSRKLFTLSAIYAGNAALVGNREIMDVQQEARRCAEFWDEVAKYMAEWKLVRQAKMTAGEVRREFLHSHALALQAIGIAGEKLLELPADQWKTRLKSLAQLDWARSNARLWEGRAMIGGRVSKASQNVTLTVTLIKQSLNLPLSPEEERAEDALRRGRDAA